MILVWKTYLEIHGLMCQDIWLLTLSHHIRAFKNMSYDPQNLSSNEILLRKGRSFSIFCSSLLVFNDKGKFENYDQPTNHQPTKILTGWYRSYTSNNNIHRVGIYNSVIILGPLVKCNLCQIIFLEPRLLQRMENKYTFWFSLMISRIYKIAFYIIYPLLVLWQGMLACFGLFKACNVIK